MLKKRRFPVITLLLAACVLPGCATPLDTFLVNRSRWAAQGIDSYSYTLQAGCFCIPEVTRPVVVTVRNGATESIVYEDTQEPADPALFERFDTIDDLFRVIEEAILLDAFQLEVAYNRDFGYPADVFIDQDPAVADEELSLTVTGFTPMG